MSQMKFMSTILQNPCIPTYVVVDTNADWSQTSSANIVCAHLLMSVAVN